MQIEAERIHLHILPGKSNNCEIRYKAIVATSAQRKLCKKDAFRAFLLFTTFGQLKSASHFLSLHLLIIPGELLD